MKHKRYLILDHDPDTALLRAFTQEHGAEPFFANSYLQAVATALRARPDTVLVRRDLSWLPGIGVTSILLDNPLFASAKLMFYTPDELRGDWASTNMHRPPFAAST